MGEVQDLEIARLGADGDGIAETASGPVYVPFALPDERVRAVVDAGRGRLVEVVRASSERAAPVCKHFQSCGGCVAQHMSDGLYEDWRKGTLAEAFRHRGIDAAIEPLSRIPLNSRRRAYLGVEREGAEVTIGFREERRHALVDMEECFVLAPEIVAALPHLADLARVVMPDRSAGRLLVTRLDHGLEVSFENGVKGLGPRELGRLAELAERARLVRLIVAAAPVVERAPAELTVGGVAIGMPPGLFFQAVEEAERRIIDLVLAALPGRARRVADLFAGVGTLTFPLARRAEVAAFDSDKRAIGVLAAAHKRTPGLKPATVRVRDLFAEPLSRKELEGFDMVVLDPPRAGAKTQAEMLARSEVPVVVAVSCNPATLARDARILIDGGYAMGTVTPIDQFLFSAHVEAVATFRRQPRARRRST